MRSGSILLVAIAMLVSACSGGSGDSARVTPTDQTCQGTSCGPEAEPPVVPLRCDGPDAASCPEGYRCVDDGSDNCDPATGTECSGICVLGEELPGCGITQQPCPSGTVCVDDPNDTCDGGPAVDCPAQCRPEATGECTTDADCPALRAPCRICPDNSASCPSAGCDAGKCTVDAPPCPEAKTCGGIAGFTCDPGFQCVDNPGDDCAPERGDADCGGICVPGQDPLRCGGIAGITCPPGLTCVDDPNDTCDDQTGADCPGRCEPEAPSECDSDEDCPRIDARCDKCPDGSQACPESLCLGGMCSILYPDCGPAIVCGEDGIGCNADETCVYDPDQACDPANGIRRCKGKCVILEEPRPCGGGAACPPGYECTVADGTTCQPDAAGSGCDGVCTPSTPPTCSDDSECPPVPGPCLPCPDSTLSCAHTACRNGQCTVEFNGCTDVGFCGGIAGFPCPLGLTCVDNPNDDCDPLNGGADCAGMCVRQERPNECGGLPGAACPPGFECADDPNDECDPTNGAADCRGICRPVANPSCSSDDECVIGAPCRICPDGSAACPKASCVNGACQVEFGGCVFPED
jgi:hypothetical protein